MNSTGTTIRPPIKGAPLLGALFLLMAARMSLSRSIQLPLHQICLRRPLPLPRITPAQFHKSRACPLWSTSFPLCLRLHTLRRNSAYPPTATTRSFSSATSSMPVAADAVDNPLLKDFVFPPFDAVRAEHVRPGIRALLKKLESEIVELEKTVEPTWPKLVEPLEKVMDRLVVVWGAVNHLKAVKDTPELRSAIEEVQPEKVELELKLGQSKPLHNAFKAIRESSDWEALSDAHKRIVEAQLKVAILNGVSLEDDKRERFNKIEQELAKLSQKFGENVLDATKKFEKPIVDKKEIEGLPATALGLAAQTAVSKGHENATAENGPWVITLDAPSFMAVMQHAQNRTLREELYRAYLTRASSGDLDNTAIIDQILKLRLEKANLLGYKNYAEVSMATKMATVEKAEELLEKLRSASWNAAVQDMEDLKQFCQTQGAPEANNLSHWDISFWSERLRESKYEINEEELRPYFSLPKVMDGLFNLAKMLFGIDIEPADGLAPVWNKDVIFFCVKDSTGNPIAYFYFDPYSRPSEKRGGAWMDEVVARSRVLSRDDGSPRLPVAHMVCNQMPPVGDKPSLMTFREVETVFHEFGHALQHMLTKQDEGLVAGIRGIEWDAVELPSQFMENWCYHRDTLMGIAKHYETGESLPEEIYNKLLAARTYRAGSQSLGQLRFSFLDLELHTKYVPGGSESIYDVDQRVSKGTQVIPPLPEDRFLCSFSHIFAGGYAAGYYSYKWAEVLSADAFSAFEDAGLNDEKAVKETGKRFRETILALGGGKAPMEVFVEFQGREPSPEALLRHNGLLSVSTSA
ncbi:probable cytosolic oligopeptidase A [Rhododendron vialii]|uniref:probable cytosolic oligopeptidase A n=1 Tax=Rhododendron vialii TaxID=182163 RepID=UPI00265F5E70|nr:probable cytosolic oligopeptidase A [Rhododendron vialii]